MKEKIIKSIINNKTIVLSSLLILLFNCIASYSYVSANESTHNVWKYAVIILFSLCEIVVTTKLLKNKGKVEHIYLLLIIPIGLFFVFFMPFGQPPDEWTHFSRAYEIANGHLISDMRDGVGGGEQPDSINEAFGQEIHMTSHIVNDIEKIESVDTKSFSEYWTASLYSPVTYIPQVIGILIGKLLSLRMVSMIYLTRLTNFLCNIIITFFSIKLLPKGKNILFVVSMLPMTIQGEASIQADGFTNAMSFLLISYVVLNMCSKRKIHNKEFVFISVATVILSLLKIVYLPLCFLLFLIPKDNFKNKKDKYFKIIGTVGLAITSNLVWLKIASRYLIVCSANATSDAHAQVMYILLHPFKYMLTLFNTISDSGLSWLLTLFGCSLGRYSIVLSSTFVLFFMFIIFYLLIKDSDKITLNKKSSFLFGFSGFIITMLTFTSLYVQWTPYQSSTLAGIQGRYFIPVVIPIYFALCNASNKSLKTRNNIIYLNLMMILSNTYAMITIINFVY